jgi:hypothetical protein
MAERHKFVKPSRLEEAIEAAAAGEKMERRNRGTMELTSAGKVEYLPRVQVTAEDCVGSFQILGVGSRYIQPGEIRYNYRQGLDGRDQA